MMIMAKTGEELSDYEKVRARNIERNNAQLRALGLISTEEEAASNATAWQRAPSAHSKKIGSGTKETKKSAHAKKRKRQAGGVDTDGTSSSSNSRKSLRLQGKQPDGIAIPMSSTTNEAAHDEEELLQRQRQSRVQECREVRLRRALEVSEEGAAKAAKENPTASYGHCLMRVQTMTEKGLANRVKAIERAAGKHSVIKMAIFKSCLQDEGMWDLAELAGLALERLKELKPSEK
jgi:hypothetical protein